MLTEYLPAPAIVVDPDPDPDCDHSPAYNPDAAAHDPDATPSPALDTPDPDMAIPKKRGRLHNFSLRRRSFDPSTITPHHTSMLRKSMERKRGPLALVKTHPDGSDGPPSSGDPAEAAAAALAPPAPRASESSRSDGSSGGHVSFENAPRPQHPARTGSSRFTFGRRKQRASLFPLPPKIEPPQFPDTAPATPRASTGGMSTSSPTRSPSDSPLLTARGYGPGNNGTQTPPLPGSSHVALASNSLHTATTRPSSLFRNDSSRSAHSACSSPQPPKRVGLRGRSSTMGSLGGLSDDNTPPNGASGRTSMSTAGRSSFSNLFGLSSRFRQHDLGSSRNGSPALGYSGASGMSSHQNSLNISRETLVMPEREEGETPGRYLERIEANNVDKSTIASFLSKTDDPFLLSVLRSYMRRFAFFGDPIDMAIRKLLMQVELPKETQQIDRVLQGFADRYHECNPGIYMNPDKAYFISFSIVILHTDFFNRNNKRKMQRNDYIKNSSCEGVSDDVLGCIYDNIVYTPFIHIEDEVDLKTITSKKSRRTAALKGPMADPTRKVKKEPIDPYTLIFEGKLDVLRPNIRDVMNLDDPYNYLGTAASLDTKNIYKSFTRYGVIQIVSSRSRPEAFMSEAAQENPLGTSVGIVEMPVTKVGIIWRKDPKRKKARSPWQEWGAVLTRSGLSLFRNSSWAKNLMVQHEQHQKRTESGPVVFSPPLQEFKQDHMVPMDGAVALVDNTYKRHKNAFVLCSKIGEETFLADSEQDLNEWLSVLNYTAAFETLGVRSRGMIGGLYEGQRNRGMRRLESSHSSTSIQTPTGDVTIQSGKIDNHFAQQVVTARRDLMQARISDSEERLAEAIKELEARLRDARHLQILAPIQPKSRELVIHAAGRLAARLKWSRVEIWRMKCHRDILAHELEDEKQSATERQARNERIAESSQPSPALSPQLSAGKTSRMGSLARLASKSSSLTSGQKPSLSSDTIRPGTKSSRDTEFDEGFKTPPETSRQSSPTHFSGQYYVPPISFSPPASERRGSFASSSAHSPRLQPADKRPSVSTMGDGTVVSVGYDDSDSDGGAEYATPPLIEEDSVEPKTPERAIDGTRLDPGHPEVDQSLPAGSPTSLSHTKHRRSLHRTLRDSHGSASHRRSHKSRDSSSTVVSDGASESEGLSRAKGSFTVHGKKASVIQFGPDWHNTTAEERLKTKKQLQEAAELASADDRDNTSVVSDGTVLSPGFETDDTPRRAPSEVGKQRHVSSQTITPQSYLEANALAQHPDSDGGSEMSDIAEEQKDTTT